MTSQRWWESSDCCRI